VTKPAAGGGKKKEKERGRAEYVLADKNLPSHPNTLLLDPLGRNYWWEKMEKKEQN